MFNQLYEIKFSFKTIYILAYIYIYLVLAADAVIICLSPIALRIVRTQWSFGHSEQNRVKTVVCEIIN